MSLRRALLALVSSGLLLTGCGGASDAPAAPSSSSIPEVTTTGEAPASTSTSTTEAGSTATTGSCRPGPAGDLDRTLTVGGAERTYRIHVPSDLGAEPVPLVVTIHGLGASARSQLAISGFPALADREGFIVAAPEARGKPAAWNFRAPLSDPTSDAAFLEAMVDDVTSTWCVDPARTYATGISNGSAVAFALACSGAFDFAAYGTVAGAFYAEPCAAAPPTSILYFHGTDDPIVPIDGGRALGAPIGAAADSLAAWAAHDDCGEPERSSPAPTVVEIRWRGCASGSEVRFVEVDGAGHTWPGSAVASPAGFGPTSQAIDASEEMWSFFLDHPAS